MAGPKPEADPWSLRSRLDDLPHGALVTVRGCAQDGRYIVARRDMADGHPVVEFIPKEEAIRRPSTLRDMPPPSR